MRKILTIALALTMCAGAAMAAHIGVYADKPGTNCTLNPPPFAPSDVYVVEKFNPGSVAAKFMINDLSGMSKGGQSAGSYLTIGNWYTGIEVAFTACVTGDHVVGTLTYFYLGSPLDCNRSIEVVAAPGSPIPGSVVIVDCTQPFGVERPASGGRMFLGANAGQCGGCNEPLATSEATWGSIKALYR